MKEKYKVYCIDDSIISMSVIEKALQKILSKKFEIISSNNYTSILSDIKENQNNIKFIVVDHVVPEMDGLAFLNWLHNNKIYIPVIVLTGSSNSEVMKQYENDILVKALLNKPIKEKEFKEKILSIL